VTERRLEKHLHGLVRLAYEQCLTAAARLASFSTSTRPKCDGPIEQRQDDLALDDLLIFAINARRLIHNTTGSRIFGEIYCMPHAMPNAKKICSVIDLIIHHTSMLLVRDDGDIQLARLGRSPDITDLIQLKRNDIKPFVIVKSDQGRETGFLIENFIEVFQEKVLSVIIDFCADGGLFLDFDRD
jgi:hypothetical protein